MVADIELSAGVGDPHLPGDYVFSFGVTNTDQEIYPHALNCSCKSGSSLKAR